MQYQQTHVSKVRDNGTLYLFNTHYYSFCSANAVAKRSAYFGHGNGDILLNGLNCSGGENDLQECSRTKSGREKCGHKNDAGVRCKF